MLLIAFYYQAYRYPLQIGDSRTSPTYIDTPAALQVGKYVLLLAVLVVTLAIAGLDGRYRPLLQQAPNRGIAICLVLLGAFGTAKGAIQGSTDLTSFSLLTLIGAGVATLSQRWTLNYATIARIISIYAVLSVVFDAVQVFLFRSQGRLPSLAYENSVSIRFGAILDDPNGFGLLVPLLLPAVIVLWRRRRTVMIIVATAMLASLVATQSFTAIAVTLVAFAVGYFALQWREANRALLVAGGVGLAGLAVWAFTSTSPVFQAVLGTKLGSFDDHASSIDALHRLTFESWLGIGQPVESIESGLVYLLANYGLIFTAAYVYLGLASLPRLYRVIRTSDDRAVRAVHCGAFFYLLSYLGASINLNVINTFPTNVLYVLMVVISLFSAPGAPDAGPSRHVIRETGTPRFSTHRS